MGKRTRKPFFERLKSGLEEGLAHAKGELTLKTIKVPVDIHSFPEADPGPYERQMGKEIVGLLRVFAGRVSDAESHACVAELAANPNRWSAGHAVFDEVRDRYLRATRRKDEPKCSQYCLEESCCQAMYNATNPEDPFDPSSAFFVVAAALGLAKVLGVSLDEIAGVFAPEH